MTATAAPHFTPCSTTTPFHVYAADGFETAHRSEAAAVRAAKRGAKRRGVRYYVAKVDAHGLTGGGHGEVVWDSSTPRGYEARGSVRGSCGHVHRTIAGAFACCERDARSCASLGGGAYSDRGVVRRDRKPLSAEESRELEERYDTAMAD